MPGVRELGKRIRTRRLHLRKSLRWLGQQVGKSHGWVLNLEKGLIQEPAAEDLTAVANALGEDPEAYLRLAGRVNLAAAKVVPSTETMPAWAVRLEEKIDALSDLLRDLDDSVTGSADGLASVLAELQKGSRQPEETQGEPSGRPPAEHRRQKKRPAGGARPSWEEEPEMESRAS